MGVAMISLGQPHKLLYSQESHDPSQHPQTNDHITYVIVTMVIVTVIMVVVTPVVIMWGNGVWDEMEEGVAQQSS